jgi:hypothetical protein
MSSNVFKLQDPELELRLLAGEVRDLVVQGQEVMKQIGERLIRIRSLLPQRLPGMPRYSPGADGNAPLGWVQWCSDNGINARYAASCIREFLGVGMRAADSTAKNRADHATYAIGGIRRGWPTWPEEERLKLINFVNNLVEQANAAEDQHA